tara:strand:+ start:3282 stop:3647 length:366 start_codon:yes stop_codon:yes gene_type:complete
MAKITLRTPSQTKNFIKRKNKFYKKLDTCVHRGSASWFDGSKDIDVKVYHYTKHRVKKIGNCVWLCKADNDTDPNCQRLWDNYIPIEKLAYMSYPPKRITCRRVYHVSGRNGNYYDLCTRD